YAAQRQDLVALGSLKRNQLDYGSVNFKIREINGGNSVLAGKKISDIFVGEKPQLHQCRAPPAIGLFLDLHRLFQLLWGDHLLLHQKVAQPLRHTSISYLIGREIAVPALGSRELAAL